MGYQGWMPMQGTNNQGVVGKSYDYSTKKNGKNSRSQEKEKDRDSFWKLDAETYEPSVDAKKYVDRIKADKAEKNEEVNLSKNAQRLLEELKEKYSNMDFFVASYSSEAEAQKYLRRGTKEYSVLIDPETLEAMAADADVRAQYEDVLNGAGDKLTQLKEQLGEDAEQIKSFGISIDSDGKVSYFAELDKISEARREQVERAKEKKAEEKKAKEKKAEERELEAEKGRFVKADSIEELLEKIKMTSMEEEH